NTDVFADQHDSRVTFHFFIHGLLDGLKKGNFSRGGGLYAGFFGSGGHGYLRAFLAGTLLLTAAAAALTAFFPADLALVDFTARGLDRTASTDSPTARGISVSPLPLTSLFGVSPK